MRAAVQPALREGYVLKNVRVFYKKKSRLRFVSHLDMNRFMPRLLRKTDIPVWYTEGFNSHVYVNFALPLSLGFESDYEVMDFKITDDDYSMQNILNELKAVCPEYIEILNVAEPVYKSGKIAFAEFKIEFNGNISEKLNEFLNLKSITVLKKNKKGIEKEIELKDKISEFKIFENENTVLKIILSAGTDNINPELLIAAFKNFNTDELPYYKITRTMLYIENLTPFI